MISSVLVPLDGSPEAEQAIPYARAVLPDGGDILLVTVVADQGELIANDPLLTEWQRTVKPGQEAAHAADLTAARAALHQVVARTADPRVTWSVAATLGDPAAQILQAAEAYREQTVAEAKGGSARFVKVYDEYKKAPDVTRQRLFLEMQERVLSGADKIILDNKGGSGVVPFLPLDQLQQRKSTEGGQ